MSLDNALCREMTLSQQPTPSPRHLRTLRFFIQSQEGLRSQLSGPGSRTWNEQERGGQDLEEFLSVCGRSAKEPPLTRWLFALLWPLLKRVLDAFSDVDTFSTKDDGKPLLQHYGNRKAWTAAADQITTLFACILILVPVIVLHLVNNSDVRLGIIVASTFIFALVTVLATNAKRSEIFAATAAFVAIQVVYVGSALNSSS